MTTKTTTKTSRKTKPYAERVEAAHAAAVEAGEEHLKALRAAQDAVPEAQSQVDQTEATLVDLEDALDRTDESVTADDLARARAEFDRATRLHAAKERRVTELGRRVLNTDLTLAAAVSAAVEDQLPGVRVLQSLALPSEAPGMGEVPVAVVVQDKPATGKGDGLVKGQVEVVYYGSAIHRPLNREALTHSLSERDVIASLVAQGSKASSAKRPDPAEVQVSRVRVNVSDAAPAMPMVTKFSEYHLRHIGSGIAEAWARTGDDMGRGISLNENTRELQSATIAARAEVEVIGNDTSAGEREVVAELTVTARPVGGADEDRNVSGTSAWLARGGVSKSEAIRGRSFDLARQVQSLAGRFVPGAGRVTEVEPVEGKSDTFRLTLVSGSR